jgi:hypothetical protein
VIPIELFIFHQLGCVRQYLVHLEDYTASCELSFEPFLRSLDDVDDEDFTYIDVCHDFRWCVAMELEINSIKTI